MRRIIALVLGGLLLFGFLVVIIWPYEPKVPVYSSSQVLAGQEERALHLKLGAIYEKGGLLEKAQDEYHQALSVQPDEISSVAKAGLERVLVKQSDPWLSMRREGRAFLVWIGKNALKLIMLATIVYMLWWCIGRLPRRPGYLLLPFNDHGDGKLGKSLVTVINSTIHQVRLMHLQGQQGIFATSENLAVPSFGTLEAERNVVSESLKAVDSFAVGTINLPLGQLLLAIQRWGSMREHMINGSIDRYGDVVRLTAEMRKVQRGTVVQTWDLSETVEGEVAEHAMRMGEALAYCILHHVCPQVEARSWRSLMLFSEAAGTMQRYRAGLGSFSTLEGAAERLESCLTVDPGYLLAKYNLGLAYSALGKCDEAKEIFQEIKEDGSRFRIEATYNLGLVYYHKFKDWAYDLAVREFEEVLGQLGDGMGDREARTLLALAHCGLAGVYAQKVGHEKEKAEEYFALVKQHYKQALALAREVQDVQAAAHSALGIAYANQNASQKAIEAFTIAIRLKADYPINYVYLADVYRQQGDEEAVIQWLRRAIRYNPRYEYAHYRLGMTYKALGEPDMAMEAWRQAPSMADAHNELGKLLAAQERYNEALVAFSQALALNSRHSEALCNLAWYTIEAGNSDEDSLRQATEYARRSLQLERNTEYEWHRRDILGWIYLNRNMYDEAARELQTSVQKNAHKAQSRYHLALVYQAKGDNGKARETLVELFNKTREKGIWRDKAEVLMRELEKEKQQ